MTQIISKPAAIHVDRNKSGKPATIVGGALPNIPWQDKPAG